MPYLGAVQLATTTLGSSASSVTFSNIPTKLNGLYLRDLILVFGGSASTRAELGIRINSDSGTNYPQVMMRGNGSTTTSAASTTETYIFSGGRVDTSRSTQIIQFMDYSATDKHKTILYRDSAAQENVTAAAARWASTNAITTIALSLPFGGTLSSGSTLSLYATVRKP